ncbi:GDP-mannose-dependent alpha-(1-6)-phosphatidylinositol monomannoside mannosyltransferase [Corynebacterium occultum]|uniref:GDP-mannose-dependent alpha-(1-6)-phosphatidylinositol monomannoside mannosyltransferase n=1 Tax=Corynebacterium occultum TaxID=2675219 RepID=A0A6B8VSF2_9CORY|nr:glycosyltransferase [Corynebacterium occultum]QGU08522.1 GDP-mannose-dependent alpha-(1-6)-phosphatidylinositol monomannoside mannosyltransferase [Corynebacterium occultum]
MTPKIALVHERFTDIAGSEHVVAELAAQWPQAKIHVPFARPEGIPGGLLDRVETSSLQPLYKALGKRSYAPLLPLVPSAMKHGTLRKSEADAVVISHHAFALAALAAVDAPSVAYVHSPARWAWDDTFRRDEASGTLNTLALKALANRARANESRYAPKVTTVVANSTAVRERIENWWHREATVVHPPVDLSFFTPDPALKKEDYFIMVGRMVPYKQVPLGVRAAVRAGVRLIVVGEGRDLGRARAVAGPNVEFRGRLPGKEMRDLIRGARALLMPGEEDFGIVPVEAMACGTPVIALGRGGALDTVRPGISGLLVDGETEQEVVENLAETMKNFRDDTFTTPTLVDWAQRFSPTEFRRQMDGLVTAVL